MVPAPPEQPDPLTRCRPLRQRDRLLLGVLGLCRYLTIPQVIELGLGAKTEITTGHRLRGLAGEATRSKIRASSPSLLRRFPFRSFDGERLNLWALTPAGYRLASGELGFALQLPRTDVGAQFAEHFVLLTDLVVRLLRPFVGDSPSLRNLPFSWDVAGDVDLPWREADSEGETRARVLRPDAVLTLPRAQRRFFIECETGANTLVAEGAYRRHAVASKLDRYETFISGLADVPSRVTHYQRRYPDGWPCEVLFLVRSERRRRNTDSAIVAFASVRANARFSARAFLLPEAAAYVKGLLGPERSPSAPPSDAAEKPFYGEPEHQAVKDFVLEMSTALAQANAALRRRRLPAVAEPESGRRMADFLRRAQLEMSRRRGADGRGPL